MTCNHNHAMYSTCDECVKALQDKVAEAEKRAQDEYDVGSGYHKRWVATVEKLWKTEKDRDDWKAIAKMANKLTR